MACNVLCFVLCVLYVCGDSVGVQVDLGVDLAWQNLGLGN